ncbi:hypothetical protein HFO56_00305 [Rhizobium laguerreae]|uniref:hypothetical protein n=1 Tax=Rhizobium laguerreae TaxID=1076926 RepID=UPI001C921BA3|nr:hypothetical protein [Rhizobium laguerreae]MBY3150870.1 hypothetical protein [Rhizobium laguerreae]MBY3433051.1 hypothetical protein [Rhizobium laguerreae]
MELEGFVKTSGTTPEGERLVEYHLEGTNGWKRLRLRENKDGNLVVEFVEGGGVPGVALGERVTSPIHTDVLEKRFLFAMASLHFDAKWLEDGHTVIDLEMIKRGYEVGKLKSGELIWYRREYGATLVVKREDSDQLPTSFTDPTRLVVVGITRKELVINALDYRSLVLFMESNAHYEFYQPHHDIHIPGVYSADHVTVH